MEDGSVGGWPLRRAAAADFRDAAGWRRVALVCVVVWMLYEWGPGNESLTPWIVARVIDEGEGAAVIAVTTSVGFTLTLVQQIVSGATALAAFSAFSRFTAAASSRLRAHLGTTPMRWETLTAGRRLALAFGLGTTATALMQIVATGRTGVRTHLAVVVRSALWCAATVGTFSGLAATIAFFGRRSERFAEPTERALDILGNPLVWLGVFTALLVAGRRRRDTPPVAAPTPGSTSPQR